MVHRCEENESGKNWPSDVCAEYNARGVCSFDGRCKFHHVCGQCRAWSIIPRGSTRNVGLYVTVYAEIGHMSAKLILRYRPRRSER